MKKRNRQILSEWSTELAEKLGRSSEEIESLGLKAGEFPASGEVKLVFADGSKVHFFYAFPIISEEKRAIGVFTEHCGYHVFPLEETRFG